MTDRIANATWIFMVYFNLDWGSRPFQSTSVFERRKSVEKCWNIELQTDYKTSATPRRYRASVLRKYCNLLLR